MALAVAPQVIGMQIGSQGLALGDLMAFAVAGIVGYIGVDYAYPKQGVEGQINSALKDVPIIGSIWSAGEGASTAIESLTSLSFIFGLGGGMIVYVFTKDSGYGILGAMGGGAVSAIINNGLFSKKKKKKPGRK